MGAHPGAGTTQAHARSTSTGSGKPTTATSLTDGQSSSSASTSATLNFSPPRLMMSLIRPVMRTVASVSMRAWSPVRKYPSSVNAAVLSSASR